MNKKKKIIVVNLFLFALLFGLISLNKEIIRPLYSHTPIMKILTGSFPNFIAAYIVSIFFVNGVIIKAPKYGRLIIYMGSFMVFLLMAIEELKPLWGVSKVYDYYDILASGLGAILAILTFELIVLKRKKIKSKNTDTNQIKMNERI